MRELPAPPSLILPGLTASGFAPEPHVQARWLHVQQVPQTQPLIFFHLPVDFITSWVRPLSCQATFDVSRHLRQLELRKGDSKILAHPTHLPFRGPRYLLRSDPKGFIHWQSYNSSNSALVWFWSNIQHYSFSLITQMAEKSHLKARLSG